MPPRQRHDRVDAQQRRLDSSAKKCAAATRTLLQMSALDVLLSLFLWSEKTARC